jgi:hypothetical protein
MTQNGFKSTNQATKEEGEKRNVKNMKNTINTTQKIKSRRTRGGKGHHSHLIISESTRVKDLSLTSN